MNNEEADAIKSSDMQEFVTFYIGEQIFGLPVAEIHEVFHPHSITPVPLSPPEIRGVLNLRGRIVTAIEVRTRLNLPPLNEEEMDVSLMAIGVESGGEAYGLIIDKVGDVLQLLETDCEEVPSNVDPIWRSISSGIYRLESELLIILDIEHLLGVEPESEMAA